MQKICNTNKIPAVEGKIFDGLKLFGEPGENLCKDFFKRQGFADVEYLE
jgi:hypothetical protein